MRYDFSKIQEAIDLGGKTLRQVQDESGIHYTTISVALKTNRARPSTAKALVKWAGISMRDVVIKRMRRKVA
jgi:hypothetical protein